MNPISGAAPRRLSFRPPHPDTELHGYVRRFEALIQRGVEVQKTSVEGLPFLKVRLPATGPNPVRVLVIASVHGDERASIAATLMGLDTLLSNPKLRERIELTVLPLANPTGFANNTRLNRSGANINRSMFEGTDIPATAKREVDLLQQEMKNGCYGLVLDVHGANSSREGFYIVAHSDPARQGVVVHPKAQALAHAALEDVKDSIPLPARSWGLGKQGEPTYDPAQAVYHLVEPGLTTTANTGTVSDYAAEHVTPLSYTLEAPQVLSYRRRAQGLNALMTALMQHVVRSVPS